MNTVFLGLILLASPLLNPVFAQDRPEPVYIIGNGWHAGLLLPASALNTRIPQLARRFPEASHYEVGWGDVGFYRAKEVTAGLALQAAFASQGTVMHVVGVKAPVTGFIRDSDIAQICLPAPHLAQMATLIADSFERSASHQPMDAGPGIYGDSQFYLAKGRYSLLNTCNRWTAAVLASAGLDISPRLSLTASSVLRAAKGSHLACQTAELATP